MKSKPLQDQTSSEPRGSITKAGVRFIGVVYIIGFLSLLYVKCSAQPERILDIIDGKTSTQTFIRFPAQEIRWMPYLTFQMDFVLTEQAARNMKKSEVRNALISHWYGLDTWKVVTQRFGGTLHNPTGKHPGYQYFNIISVKEGLDSTKPYPLRDWYYRAVDNQVLCAVRELSTGNYQVSFVMFLKSKR